MATHKYKDVSNKFINPIKHGYVLKVNILINSIQTEALPIFKYLPKLTIKKIKVN